MKSALIALALLATPSAFACLGEAQVIAIVQGTQKSGQISCKAFINPHLVQFYAPSGVCPLDISELVNEGVEVGMVNGHDCALTTGESLNGIVVRNSAGVLRLE